MNHLIQILVGMSIVVGCSQSGKVETSESQKVPQDRSAYNLNEIFPQRLIDRLSDVGDVDVCLVTVIRPERDFKDLRYVPLISPYHIREISPNLGSSRKKELVSILTDPNSYRLGEMRLCGGFHPHLAYILFPRNEVARQENILVVFMSANCASVRIKSLDTQISLGVDYSMDRLLDLMIGVFPDDSLSTVVYDSYLGKFPVPPN